METVDLSTDDGLRRACEAVEQNADWCKEITEYLDEIADPSLATGRFVSEDFQQLLWIKNPIATSRSSNSNTGRQVKDAISREEFRRRFRELYDEIPGRWRNQPRTERVPVEILATLAGEVLDLLNEN